MIKITFDNGEEYTEEMYKRDFFRYFKAEIDPESKADPFHQSSCMNWPCENCTFDKYEKNAHLHGFCQHKTFYSFENIKKIYEWSKEHPLVTNRDKMIETFGNKNFNFILSSLRNDMIDEYGVWLSEEYKEESN